MHYLPTYIFVLAAISSASSPEDFDATVDLGYARLETEGPEAAAETFRAVLARRPEHTEALRGLVLAGLRPEADDALAGEALDAARWLMTLNPADRAALDQWSQLHVRLEGPGERRFRGPWNGLGPPGVPVRVGDRPARIRTRDGRRFDIVTHEFDSDAGVRATEHDYAARLANAAGLGANTVRVARLMSPEFYRALAAHNRETDAPLFLIQGVWSKLSAEGDSCGPDPAAGIDDEIERVIDAVHGNLVLSPRACRASGVYDTDVSSSLLAYAIGSEWKTLALDGDDLHTGKTACEGKWLRTDDPRPIECGVVRIGDRAVAYEAESYGVIHPVSFVNWPSLDTALIRPTAEMEAGIFVAGEEVRDAR